MPVTAVELEDTPFFAQKKYQCGPSALAMVLGASGVDVRPGELASITYVPGRRGSLQVELVSACRQYGRIPYRIDPDLAGLRSQIRGGRPVLVMLNQGFKFFPAYHYAVVIGLLPRGKVVLRSGIKKRVEMNVNTFRRLWKRAGAWGLVCLRPGDLPPKPDPSRYLDALRAFEATHPLKAVEGYRAALDRWPDNHTALFALANNYLLRGKELRATRLYRKLLFIYPEHVAAANNLAEALARQGLFSQALAVINKAVRTAEQHDPFMVAPLRETRREIRKSCKMRLK